MYNTLHAEKNNNLKINSVFVELSNALTKIEKAHNIKTYSMIPIKDLMARLQTLVKSSAKLHGEFQKKAINQ